MSTGYTTDIPYLTSLTKTSVRTFLQEYETYAARRSKPKAVGSLISSPILISLRSIDPSLKTDFSFEEFKAATQMLFGTRRVEETLVALQRLVMKNDGSVDSLMSYWQSYQEALLFVPKRAQPSTKQLAGVFKSGIRPTSVQNLLGLVKPETMEDSFKLALKLLQEEDSAMDRFKLSRQARAPSGSMSENARGRATTNDNKRKPNNSTGGLKKKPHAQRGTVKPSSEPNQDTKETIKCYNCGEQGHMAKQCPKGNGPTKGNSKS